MQTPTGIRKSAGLVLGLGGSDEEITSLEATAYASAGEAQQLEITDYGAVIVHGPESRIVVVHAVFEEGGDVSYAWRVARQIIVGVGDDHVAIVEPLVEVTPLPAPGDATIHLSYTDWELLGVEGAAMFLKATDPKGTVILDRIVSPQKGQERLPPGEYVLTAYYRACDGNCDVLDPPESMCSVHAVLGRNESIQLVISVSQRSCEARQGD